MATALATAGQNAVALAPEAERFALRQRQARMFAMSPLVPEHLRKGPPEQAMANCYIALTLAEAMGEVPLIVMQNIHVVNGKAGFASQYMIARANSSGVFKDCIDWNVEGAGDNMKVTAFATIASTGRRVEVSVDMAMAKAEGWTKNPKYRTMPEIMLRYRSAAFLVRFYAPQVMLGYHTVEEVEDVVTAGMEAAQPITGAALLEQASTAVIDEETGEVLDGGQPADTIAPDAPNAEEGPADEQRGEAHTDTAGAGDEPAMEGPAEGEAGEATGPASPEEKPTLQERMSALAAEAKGETTEDASDWPAWLETFAADIARCGNAPDVNSAYADARATLDRAPDDVQARAFEIKSARIAAIKGE